MREDAFRAFLTPRLGVRSVDSYLSDSRATERLLGLDLDHADLSDEALRGIGDRLVLAGMSNARARNCRSALAQYRQVATKHAASPSAAPATAPRPRAGIVRAATVAELMALYADVLHELRARNVIRTANGPIGDYAERLFTRAFGWTLATNCESGHDAVDASGLRYQIKARRLALAGASRQLGALRSLPARNFDVLAACLFDADCNVLRAALIPYDVAFALARRTDHTNSWRLMLADRVWNIAGVQDVTAELRVAAAEA